MSNRDDSHSHDQTRRRLLQGMGANGNQRGGMGGTAVAEETVGSGLIVAFIAVVPMMIALANLVFGLKPGRMELAGIGVGLIGVLMLTQGAGFQASTRGLVAITVACVTWSIGSVLSQFRLPR